MSALRAVVPPAILRRWDSIASDQLLEVADAGLARVEALAAECEELRRRLHQAEDAAEFWYQNAHDLASDEGSPGLTVDGHMVRA